MSPKMRINYFLGAYKFNFLHVLLFALLESGDVFSSALATQVQLVNATFSVCVVIKNHKRQ